MGCVGVARASGCVRAGGGKFGFALPTWENCYQRPRINAFENTLIISRHVSNYFDYGTFKYEKRRWGLKISGHVLTTIRAYKRPGDFGRG